MSSPRYQYRLDGTLYNDPIGWEDWKSSVERDNDLRGIVEQQQGKFTFAAEAYSYLYTTRKQGFCATVAVEIWEDCSRNENYQLVFEGVIFLSDTEFDITHCLATCELIDNSFFAKINNNKQVECSLNAGKSKNGVDIDQIDLWSVQMFNPCDGLDSGLPKPKAYRAYDVGRYLVQFMSDGQMEFESTPLDFGGVFEATMLTKGLLIGDPANTDTGVIFTWDNFLRNISNLGALSWKIERRSSGWALVLEITDDLYAPTISMNLPNANKIIRQVDQARNYAAVELGTDDIIESLGCGVLGGGEPAFPDQINLLGCKREQYAVTGTCNIDSILDLTSDWIISSNVIENIYFNGDTGYDDRIILLDCEDLNTGALTAEAIKGDIFGITPPVFYNTRFYNSEVVKRHFRRIPSTLVKYLNAPDTGFKASRTTAEVVTLPGTVLGALHYEWPVLAFGNDYTPSNYDLNNDYGNGTGQGSPVSQWNSAYIPQFGNVYRFKNTFHILPFNPGVPSPYGCYVKFTYMLYDNADTPLADFVTEYTYPSGDYGYKELLSPLIYVAAGYKIRVKYEWILGNGNPNPANTNNPMTFELAASGLQGGTFEIFNPEEFIGDTYSLTYPLSMAQYKTIMANKTAKITADDGKNFIEGWIENLTYNRHTHMAEIKLINDGR